ncbi:Gfo/Idh/MocA family oxidoreductase [Brachyspira sp.]|uniref:Gfo/Idh/MocA family protein n=1 Tax=Brachyspira sp. TaxID=1977261 RepID=UPI0026040605|nr:Gfo/Idh/MocA family oxidoreductase [Brachyspira sp.]
MVKVAIVGGGFMGTTHAKGYKNIGVEIVAIADIDKKAKEDFMKTYNCKGFDTAQSMMEEIHSEIDYLDVCIPTYQHEEMVLLATKYNKHVLSEKPFALTLEAIDNMLEATQKANSIFMIGQVLHFWPEYAKIKKWIDQGIFGEIKLATAVRLGQHPVSEWYGDINKSGGGIYDLHVHDIDFLCYLFGDVEEVYATGKKARKDAWNFVDSTLRFKNGVNATAQAAFGITDNYPFSMNLRIVGEKATAEFSFSAGFNLEDIASAKNSLILYRNGEKPYQEPPSTRDPYEIEIEYFANCVKEGKQPEIVKPKEVRKSIQAILALIKSLETGQVIKI